MIYEKSGKVIKGLGGLYDIAVKSDVEGYNCQEILSCRAKGVLHKDEAKLYVGDNVRVTFDDSLPDSVVVSEIFPRSNSLIRPPLANLDYLFITIAAKKPTPALDVVDKLLAIAHHNNIEPILVITKLDLSESLACEYAEIYKKCNVQVFITSSNDRVGTAELREYIDRTIIDGKTAAFAGASGVGKSSLMNVIFPNLSLSTSEISHKIERGRHTTRHVELFGVGTPGHLGFIADTPGFSLVDFSRFDFFELEDLERNFPDISAYSHMCRYDDCSHFGESTDECAVAKAAECGDIAPSRLESYRSIYRVLKEKKKY